MGSVSDLGSLFSGASSLANLFTGASSGVSPTTGSTAGTSYDPMLGGTYYDPTGSIGATTAITGAYPGVNTGASSGGTPPSDQTDTQTTGTGKGDRQDSDQQPSGPAPVTPQSLQAMMQGQPLPTASASPNPWQIGGGQPVYFTDPQREAGLRALQQGQGTPTSRWQQETTGLPPSQSVANRFGDWQSTMQGPEGGANEPGYKPGTATTTPPGQMADANVAPASASNAAPVPPAGTDTSTTPPDTSTKGSQDSTPPADTSPPAATAPAPTPQGPGAGGFGNIIGDLLGLMSGNPMALQRLAQDFAQLSGQRQMPGWNQPWMRPDPARPYIGPGDPSTFGGQQSAGAYYPNQPVPPRVAHRPGQLGQRPQQPADRTPPPYQAAPGAMTQPGQMGPGPVRRLNTAPGQTVGGGGRAFDVNANPQGPLAAPSMRGDGSFPRGQAAVGPVIATTLRQAGLPNAAIQGIMYNISRESSFDPSNVTRGDQKKPKWRGTEAANAHGLYQEGADEWNNYTRWLGNRNWRDPQLQTEFLADNLRRNYPQLWNQLRYAQSPEQAASLFASQYLRPSPPNLIARLNDIRSGAVRRIGVPEDQAANRPLRPLTPSQTATVAGMTQ